MFYVISFCDTLSEEKNKLCVFHLIICFVNNLELANGKHCEAIVSFCIIKCQKLKKY